MDVKKFFVTRAMIWLIAGLIGGGIAADWWERQRAMSDIADLKARQADRLSEVQAKLEELTRQLNAERERRQALEQVLAELRRGS